MQDKVLKEVFNDLTCEELDSILKDVTIDETIETNINSDKIKAKTMEKINDEKSIKRFKKAKIAAAAMIGILLLGISPIGTSAIAAMNEKLFFVEGKGMIKSVNPEDIYVLKEPINLKLKGDDFIVRSIVSTGKKLEINLVWIGDHYDGMPKGIVEVKTSKGKIIKSEPICGGGNEVRTHCKVCIDTDEQLKNFELSILGDNFFKVQLNKLKEANMTNEEVSKTVNDIEMGGKKFTYNNKTFISLWTNKDEDLLNGYKTNPSVFLINKHAVEILDEKNKNVTFDDSIYSDREKVEFQIDNIIKEQLTVSVKEILLHYNLNKAVNIKIPIPKDDEEISINKTLNFDEMKVSAKIIKVYTNAGLINVDIDFGNTDDTKIVNMMLRGKSYGGHIKEGSTIYTYTFDKKDLNMKEKLTNNIDFHINALEVIQKGQWSFKVK